MGINDRVELSLGHQDFDTGVTGTALGLPGLHLHQNIVGAKVRVAGDAVLDSDSLMPQIAVGVQFKQLESSGLDGTLNALGAKRSGTDVYVSATKLFLAQGILVNGTLRATKANQNGLLGFGATLGGADNGYEIQPEISVAYLINSNLAVGFEYRGMPNKLQRAGTGRRPGRRPARRRLERHLHRLGTEQERLAHRRLRGPGPHRAGHHRRAQTDRRVRLGPDRFLNLLPL